MTKRLFVSVVMLAGQCCAHAASVEIHPAGPTIPENLLRMELRFARPQPLPFDSRRLKLVDADGREIENALLDLTLPSADGRRITVLMDPGRVKSGVGPNLDAGRAIRAGAMVSLRIDDATVGNSSVAKTWRVTAAVSHPIEPGTWQLSSPQADSRDPLVVDLREPISSSGEGLMAVLDAGGHLVRGKTALAGGDATWRFTPARPWRLGLHTLITRPDLEDAAGNRLCAAFEQLHASTVSCHTGARIPFEPRRTR